jgi:hypothetical protein
VQLKITVILGFVAKLHEASGDHKSLREMNSPLRIGSLSERWRGQASPGNSEATSHPASRDFENFLPVVSTKDNFTCRKPLKDSEILERLLPLRV